VYVCLDIERAVIIEILPATKIFGKEVVNARYETHVFKSSLDFPLFSTQLEKN